MTEYNFEIYLYKQIFNKNDSVVIDIIFDGSTICDKYDIQSTDQNNPDIIEFAVNREPGNYDITIVNLNKEYIDTDNDGIAIWRSTRLKYSEFNDFIRWGNSAEDMDNYKWSWFNQHSQFGKISTTVALPYDWSWLPPETK